MAAEKLLNPGEVSSLLFGRQLDHNLMFINAVLALESGNAETVERMAPNISPEIFVWAQATVTATSNQPIEVKKIAIRELLDVVKPPKEKQWETAYHEGREAVVFAIGEMKQESREQFEHAIALTKPNRNTELLATEIKLRQLQARTLGDFLDTQAQDSLWKEIEVSGLTHTQKANTGISLLVATSEPSDQIISGIQSHTHDISNLEQFWIEAINDISHNNGFTTEELCQFLLTVPTQEHWSSAGTSFTNESKARLLITTLNRLPLESDITPIFSTLRHLKVKESAYVNVFSDLLTRTKSHRSKSEEKIFPAPVIQIEELKSTIENIQDDQIAHDTVFEIMKWTKVLEDKGRRDIRQSYAIETALPSLEARIPSIQNDQTYLEAAARCVFWRLNSPELMEQNIALLNEKLQFLLTSPNQYPWDIKTSWVISKVIKFAATTNQRTGSQSALEVLKKSWDFVEVFDGGEQGDPGSLRPHSRIKPRTYNTNGELYRVLLQLQNDGGLDDISKLEPRIAQAKEELIDLR